MSGAAARGTDIDARNTYELSSQPCSPHLQSVFPKFDQLPCPPLEDAALSLSSNGKRVSALRTLTTDTMSTI